MSIVKGIGHTALRARDVEATAAFYRDILGFREAFRMNNEEGKVATIYMHLAPGQFVELFSGGEWDVEGDDGKRVGHCHMCYVVEDIHEALETVKERGAQIDTGITKGKSGCLQFWIHDPDGNKVELMQILPDSKQAAADR